MRYILALLVLVAMGALTTPAAAARPDSGVSEGYEPNEAASPVTPDSRDVVQIYQVQAAFDRAVSTKDLDLMTALFADDAAISMNGRTYAGRTQVRDFFATVAGAFKPENHWMSLTPSPRIHIVVQGDRAALYFECIYIDVTSKQLKADLYADARLVRSNGKWLIRELRAGPATLL